MNRRQQHSRKSTLLLPLVLLLLTIPGRSCGPDWPTAVFVMAYNPGGDYASFARGHLGVPQQKYRTRDLVLLYDWLTQRPLSPAEQKQAVAVQHHYMDGWDEAQKAKKNAPPTGLDTWVSVRSAFGLVDGGNPSVTINPERAVDPSGYNTIVNCLDDAFATAVRTLTARVQAYGATNPAVVEWVRGQDAVFTNCSDGRSPRYFGPGQAPPPPPAPHSPQALPGNAPVWLKQDRAYQLAAAHFYATDFDAAATGFRAVAADNSSPWSMTSRYLIARCLIRRAALIDNVQNSNPSGDSAKDSAIPHAKMPATLGQAQKELLAMRSEARMTPMRGAIDDLLDYVNLRLQPDKQAVVLAGRLHAPGTPRYAQSLIDLTYIRVGYDNDVKTIGKAALMEDATGMLHWIDVFSTGSEARALEQWRATPTTVWLLAAMSYAQPGDAAAPELIHAAESIAPSDPAWTAITYHRLRLMPRDAATREQLLAVLPAIEKSESLSTVNLFTALNTATAPTLETWLASAARMPVGEADENGVDNFSPDEPAANGVCGNHVKRAAIPLFDLDAAYAFNNWFPLHTLAKAAESTTLPENLRYQVAQAAWARAVMLDRPEIAHRMTPLLVACRVAWKPILATYDTATTADERKATGLLALMRFASTEPSVRYGEERRNGFATYDEYRQNWWCSTIPPNSGNEDTGTVDDLASSPAPPAKAVPYPFFLTPADRSEAEGELAQLRKIPNAANYFATEALAWQQGHPHDPRTADLLGEALRVERNSCSEKSTPALAHELFDVLHRNYPQSAWTKKYPTWE